MNLKTRLQEDMKAAMRSKDALALSAIRLTNAAVKQFEVDERAEADDNKIAAIIAKMIKQRKDSAQIYTDAGRADLAEKELAEVDILARYLPQMLSAGEIADEVRRAAAETGATGMADMGKVMGLLKTRLAGKADMGEVNQAVKSVLSQG